jgi:hypothetical protein
MLMHQTDSNGPKNYLFGWFYYPNHCCCCYRVSLSTFSCHFRPRPESATCFFHALAGRKPFITIAVAIASNVFKLPSLLQINNGSLWCTRAVGTVPVSDAPRRWSDCTIPPLADADPCRLPTPLPPSCRRPGDRYRVYPPTGNFRTREIFGILCSPNEDWGRWNKR